MPQTLMVYAVPSHAPCAYIGACTLVATPVVSGKAWPCVPFLLLLLYLYKGNTFEINTPTTSSAKHTNLFTLVSSSLLCRFKAIVLQRRKDVASCNRSKDVRYTVPFRSVLREIPHPNPPHHGMVGTGHFWAKIPPPPTVPVTAPGT